LLDLDFEPAGVGAQKGIEPQVAWNKPESSRRMI